MNALDALKSRMAFQPMTLAKIHQESPVVAQMERTVKKMLGGRNDVAVESPDRVLGAVQAFLDGQQVTSVVTLRRLSYGLSLKTNQLSIFDSPRLTAEFFGHRGAAGFLKSTSGLKRTYHGVLVSYFSHPWGQALDMKRSVSAFLQENLHKLEALKIRPAWVDLLITYPGILTESPYKPFAQQALEHHFSLKDELKPIGIPESSWLIKDFVLGAVTELTALDDAPFESRLREILRLIESHESVFNQCFKLVLDRYAGLQSPREHAELKALALRKWGVPWLRSNSMWQTVTENAKNLVSNWIKSEFVEAFFGKLSEDWNSDTRRYAFWKKYIPLMRSVEFGLTSSMMRSPEKDLVQLREKLRGLYAEVVGYNVTNAVIMRFDDFVAVEFGTTSNAAYFYEPQSVPFDISKALSLQSHNPLKRLGRGAFKWNHNGDWEKRFETDLMHKFGLDVRRATTFQSRSSAATHTSSRTTSSATTQLISNPQVQPKAVNESSTAPDVQIRTINTTNVESGNHQNRVSLQKPKVTSPLHAMHAEHAARYFREARDKQLSMKVLQLFERQGFFKINDLSAMGGVIWLKDVFLNAGLNNALVARGFKRKEGKGYWISATDFQKGAAPIENPEMSSSSPLNALSSAELAKDRKTIPQFIPISSRQAGLANILKRAESIDLYLVATNAELCGYVVKDTRSINGFFLVEGLPVDSELALLLRDKGFFLAGDALGFKVFK